MIRSQKYDNLLEGSLERFVYSSDDTGFVVARLKAKNEPKLITITGTLAGANIGDYLKMKGKWEIHPEYGQQFKVVSYEAEQPATVEGIIKYLSNSLIKGIGPKTAERIVAHWGEKSLDIIENDPDRLKEIEGIGKHKRELIKKGWREQKAVKNLMLFLHRYGVNVRIAHKLFKEYGDQAFQVISSNPYKLAADIYGIGFKTADSIALKLGLEPVSAQRIEAAIIFLLADAAEEGHCFVPTTKMIIDCSKLLDVSQEEHPRSIVHTIERQIDKLAAGNKIIIVTDESAAGNTQYDPDDLISVKEFYNSIIYHPFYYHAENNSAQKLAALEKNSAQCLACFQKVDWQKAFNWLETKTVDKNIHYSEEQKNAIIKCLTNKVTVLTGGPGTGKSTVTEGIVKLARAKKKKVLLAAPTGRAAKRLSEVTRAPAQTIHRLLEFSWQNGLEFRRNNDNPLEADLIIIDEVSMLDIMLLNHLLKAVRTDSHLVLIGDVDQLPSVGPGYVLKDLISSNRVPVIKLNKIFRQSSDSHIITNAHRIKVGNMPVFSYRKGDFFFFGADSPEKSAELVVRLVTEKIPGSFGYSADNDIQVLAPMHKGVVGISELNRMLQQKLNPSKGGEELTLAAKTYRKGDRVIQLRNNYEKEVFNGDFGRITGIDREKQTMIIEFENSSVSKASLPVEYDFSDLDQITHSYAISIHKSQGSEFPVVVLPLNTQHFIMLQRNLLYTAVTRAKKLVVIVGNKKAIDIALRNDKSTHRNTRLASVIQNIKE